MEEAHVVDVNQNEHLNIDLNIQNNAIAQLPNEQFANNSANNQNYNNNLPHLHEEELSELYSLLLDFDPINCEYIYNRCKGN